MLSKSNRRLAIFDIDGTLTDTNDVDNECFLQAIADTFRLNAAALDWADAPHVTDAALLDWLCRQHCGRLPGVTDAEDTITRFLDLLRQQLASQPSRFRPIPGAPLVLDRLRAAGWEIALATGGWRPSAQLKLTAIGIDPAQHVLVTSSDGFTRRDILELAVRGAQSGDAPFDRIVSIGDGIWDVRVAAELQWPFVGIGNDERALRLRKAGAAIVLPDLSDVDAVLHALTAAQAPAIASIVA